MNIARKRLWKVRLFRWPKSVAERISGLFSRIPPRFRILTYCAALVLPTTLLVSHFGVSSVREHHSGEIATADVVVPVDLQVIDQKATAERKRQARERLAPVFDFDPLAGKKISQQITLELEALALRYRQLVAESFKTDAPSPAEKRSPAYQSIIDTLAAASSSPDSPFKLDLPSDAIAALASDGMTPATLRAVGRAVETVVNRYVYDDSDATLINVSGFQLSQEPNQDTQPTVQSSAISVSAARLELQKQLQRELPALGRASRAALAAPLEPLVKPNLIFNPGATAAAQQRAEETARPVVVSLPRNLVLLRAGDMITEDKLPMLKEVRQYQMGERQPMRLLALLIVVSLIYYTLYQVATTAQPSRLSPRTNFWVAGSAVLIETAIVRLGMFIAAVLSTRPETMRLADGFNVQLGIPYAACAVVLSLLLGSQVSLVAALVVALFAGLIAPSGLNISLFALCGSIAAIYGAERYRSRNAIIRASFAVGVINVAVGIAARIIDHREVTWRGFAGAAVFGLVGALITAAIASFATPLYESVFDILTDLKLLELSNADLPLLRQLAIQTPGTNHHSFVVGTLAEAAAKAVGANPLLTRVGCLYHDIGKLAAPKMYIENQQGGPNPHDRVSPRDSVRIITGHVRRGLQMAEEAKLPQQIIDFIPQHHGTRAVVYFYHKARAQAEARGETVDINDFRYPGPKPRTKEAVILMLSDAAEAAVRSLEEPTPENIESIIKKICDSILADGQLDECQITFHELTLIRESLLRTLVSIYHQRISYPGFNPPAEGGEPDDGNYEIVHEEPGEEMALSARSRGTR
jgi:cyclic-di-AMP phosphodiesterase PgpH